MKGFLIKMILQILLKNILKEKILEEYYYIIIKETKYIKKRNKQENHIVTSMH